jgi:hypothetical protein
VTAARRGWIRSYSVAFALLALSGVLAWTTSVFIAEHFPDRPLVGDLGFEILPFIESAQYLTDPALFFGVLGVLYYFSRGRWHEAPGMISLYAIMEIVRALVITLTPMASPLGNGYAYGLVPMTQHGMFLSGHTASAAMFVLVVDREQEPRLWWLQMLWLVIEATTLLLSRGHYSIDIVGGLLLAYALWRAWHNGVLFNRLKPLVTP